MFTGIIEEQGRVTAVEPSGDGVRLTVQGPLAVSDAAQGDSIAVSGVCLTVVDKSAGGTPGWFAVDVSHETVSRTAAQWAQGHRLNLERALKLGDELGGHIVTGHVDGTGTVLDITPDGDSQRITFSVPAALAPFIAAKGSITIDGVSLTTALRDRDE